MAGYSPERYARRRAAGLCARCPEPAVRGKSRCPKHRQNDLDESSERTKLATTAGLCSTCRKRPRPEGPGAPVTCDDCRQKYREKTRAYRAREKAFRVAARARVATLRAAQAEAREKAAASEP